MFYRNTRYLAGIASGLAVALLAGTAGAATLAAPNDQAPAVTVHFQDLDLATTEGRSTLYRRISRAAQSVCPAADVAHLSLLGVSRDCQSAAIQRAVRSIGGPTMAQLAAEHGVTLG